MKKVMHMMLLSCLMATELIEKKMDNNVPFFRKMQLNIHVSLCKACKTYKKQSTLLDEALKGSQNSNGKEIDMESFKKSIISKIDKH